jgi:hypothetical protein
LSLSEKLIITKVTNSYNPWPFFILFHFIFPSFPMKSDCYKVGAKFVHCYRELSTGITFHYFIWSKALYCTIQTWLWLLQTLRLVVNLVQALARWPTDISHCNCLSCWRSWFDTRGIKRRRCCLCSNNYLQMVRPSPWLGWSCKMAVPSQPETLSVTSVMLHATSRSSHIAVINQYRFFFVSHDCKNSYKKFNLRHCYTELFLSSSFSLYWSIWFLFFWSILLNIILIKAWWVFLLAVDFLPKLLYTGLKVFHCELVLKFSWIYFGNPIIIIIIIIIIELI